MMISKEPLNVLRKQFPAGSRIRLGSMEDPYSPVPPGTEGTLVAIDDVGNLLMEWDNGQALSLIPGVDSFRLLPPPPQMLKLYMPLTASFYGRDEYGCLTDCDIPLDGRDLLPYQDSIAEAIMGNRMPEESERGIMHWYHEDDAVNQKVLSVVFTVEARDKQLWGVAECKVQGQLTPKELKVLTDYITGQASDGWGEGFEQQDIKVADGELYVSLWNSERNWNIQTEQERFYSEQTGGMIFG